IYALYYVPLIILTIALSRWNPLRLPGAQRTYRLAHAAVVSQIIVFALLILHPLSGGRPDGRLRVDFLDVGQGDSALVIMPDCLTLFIDGGGTAGFLRK